MAKKMPQRQCVGCREMKNKQDLWRILRTPEDEVLLDPTGKKNGRGAYICKNQACLEKAKAAKGLERSLHRAIEDEVYDRLLKEFEESNE